jgi:hypothetical protein
MLNKSARPAILIDLKKDRIRIYKRTLHAIGNPQYILLLVNPEDRTIVILRSDRSDQRAFHLPQARPGDRLCVELNSKALVQNLRSMCDDWIDAYSYRIYGEIVKNEGAVQFRISESVSTSATRGKKNVGI